ncbi:MAG: DUF1838 family protein [Gammaproteobacteria bacterium]
MVDTVDDHLSRRRWLGSLALGAGLAAGHSIGLPEADAAVRRDLPDLSDPEVNLRNIVRMQGSLREEDVRWWFTGMIFAVRGDNETPKPLVRFEGMEVYWFAHRPEGFQLGGHTVTFFRDVETRDYLREFKNPWTGRIDEVKPAVQGGNLGFSYSKEGIWPVRLDGSPLGEPKRGPLKLQWHSLGDHVWLQHQTVYPAGMSAMHGQRQSLFTRRQDFLDSRLAALPATFSSTVFMGWLKWMNMTGEPGHVIWHAAGAKLRSIEELPLDYRERAEREYPERMTAKPK